ncbi:MAG: hypothetical protein MUC29_00325 [Pyrinomonadaceae bacterium]|jgi:hypothetical protein|nr:hypothetical protein [Pyrinomonadaceae bacterium]
MKNFLVLIIVSIFWTINLFAQTNSEILINGILTESENNFFVADFKIKPKLNEDGKISFSDENLLKSLVGKEVKVKGNKLDEKNIEFIEIDDVIYTPTEKDYPIINNSGKNINDFIPKNWNILKETFGDLNNDSINDAVIVIKDNNQKFVNYSQFDSRGNTQWLVNPITKSSFKGYDGNPRILLVLFGKKDGYTLFLQNNSFIPTPSFPTGETFESLKIKKNVLDINFKWNDNHWVYGNSTHKFKFLNGEIILTAFDILKMRTAGYGVEKSYDFLNKTVKQTEIQERGKIRENIQLKSLTPDKTFNLKKAISWEIEEVYKDLFDLF